MRLVVSRTGKEWQLRDEGGSLKYFCDHVKIVTPKGSTTPSKLIDHWQRQGPPELGFDAEVEVQVAQPATATIEYEAKFQIRALRFHCKVERTMFIGGLGEDPYVNHAMSTVYSAIDHRGETVAKIPARGLRLGLGTHVVPGKFYEDPKLKFAYWCEEISPPDIATMILLESYQHGRFIQAEFTFKSVHSEQYVEVTDRAKLRRLKRMLKEFRSRKVLNAAGSN
jgi:hypothetical protein